MKKILNFVVLVLLLNGCSQKPASVVYKGSRRYTKNYYDKNKNDIASNNYNTSPDGRIVRKLRGSRINTQKQTNKKTYNFTREIKVKNGDTLYGLAEENDISSREIIEANNLKPPYLLKTGQRLKVPDVKYHTVQEGENLYVIAKKYDINLNSLVSANELEQPYIIRKGDRLKLPSSASSYSIAKVANNKKKVAISNNKKTKVSKPRFKRNSFTWPAKGTIISKFGPKDGGLYNDGINIAGKEGTPFKATEDGVVAYVGNELRGYGNLIIVKHSGNWVSAYAHCKDSAVKRGDKIKRGDVIGYIGSTGNVKRPQLYFSLRKGRKSINPEDKLI